MDDLIRRSEAQELLECYTEKNNLGHTPYQIVSNLPSAGPKWISVEERLPLEGEDVLAWETHGFAFVDHQRNGKWVICDDVIGGITHWMPLPEPPKVG